MCGCNLVLKPTLGHGTDTPQSLFSDRTKRAPVRGEADWRLSQQNRHRIQVATAIFIMECFEVPVFPFLTSLVALGLFLLFLFGGLRLFARGIIPILQQETVQRVCDLCFHYTKMFEPDVPPCWKFEPL